LLREAQQEIAAGQFDSARGKIEQARGFDVTYNVFDLRPEHLLAELARHQPARPEGPSEMLSDLTRPSPESTPEIRPQPTARPGGQMSAKAQATQLLADAQAAFSRGHLNGARDLALQAQSKDVTW